MRRTSVRVAVAVLSVLVLLVGGLWLWQRRLIYFPDPSRPEQAPIAVPGGVDVFLPTTDGLSLGAYYVPAPAGCAATVLVAGGNAGNRGDRAPLARALVAAGLGVLVMDYRGYGGNPGSPSEDGLRRDARAAAAFLVATGVPADRTIYFGESLGGGVVTDLAIDHPPAALVLRSPFTELADVAADQVPYLPVRWLLRDRYPVAANVARIDVPVTVVYGARDTVVAPSLSIAVARAATGPSRLVRVPDADHNDPVLSSGPIVVKAVQALAGNLDCR